jgi:hypothetical protein
MKLEIETFQKNANSILDPNPDSTSIEPFNFSKVHSSHEYVPFYALHNSPVKAKNIQLLKEEIRILEDRIKELKQKLYHLQHTS